MTLDSLQPEDIQRIFGHPTQITLEEINQEMGNKVLDVWIDTGIKQAHKQHVLPYEVPQYLEAYIKQRYEAYHGR